MIVEMGAVNLVMRAFVSKVNAILFIVHPNSKGACSGLVWVSWETVRFVF